MNDELDGLSNDELNIAFAKEVDGRNELSLNIWALPLWSEEADAILPYMEKWSATGFGHSNLGARVNIEIESVYFGEGQADSFARAACIALLRAYRSKKQLDLSANTHKV